MAQLWRKIHSKETDELVYRFNASIMFDRRLYRQDIPGERGAREDARESRGLAMARRSEIRGLSGRDPLEVVRAPHHGGV